MLTHYHTLRSLVREWKQVLRGARITDIWSQEKGEISISFDDAAVQETDASALKISVQSPLRYAYVSTSTARARKNTVTLFEDVIGSSIEDIHIADRDRLVEIELRGGKRFRIELFGPQANVYMLDSEGIVSDRFRKHGVEKGEKARQPRPFTLPDSATAFGEALDRENGNLNKRLARAVPVFDAVLVAEALQRARLTRDSSVAMSTDALDGLWVVVEALLREMESPVPTVYWHRDRARMFSIIHLETAHDYREERFESTNPAIQTYVRRKRAQAAFDRLYDPLDRLISSKLDRARRTRERMASGLARESRADAYEKYGHLLMACQKDVPARSEEIVLPDIIAGTSESIAIKLAPELNVVENAQRYYARARETRRSREESETRLKGLEREIKRLETLHTRLEELDSAADVERFRKSNREALASLSSQGSGMDSEVPYRRFRLQDGYEVWVGRNAAQNDRLTLRDARKSDLWLHARGVAGSHTVLRKPRRNEKPPRHIVETAASIAAFFSKARTSELAPVIVVERRYVRKQRKSPPGTVVVEREQVLMVSPRLPKNAAVDRE